MNTMLKSVLIFGICLPIIPCFQAEECSKVREKASLECYHYRRYGNGLGFIKVPITFRSQLEIDDAYVFTVNQTRRNVYRVWKVECVKFLGNAKYWPDPCRDSSYIIIKHGNEKGCAMKFQEGDPQLMFMLSTASSISSPSELNLTCSINPIEDRPHPFDENPYAKTSLISIIFLSVCAGLTFIVCVSWSTYSYYLRSRLRRNKREHKKALENSVQKYLNESPIIVFNSKMKTQHFTDDDPMCAICLESFKENDKLRKLRCAHYFHTQCIDPWVLAHQNCPLCNQNILDGSIPSISARMTITNDESTIAPVVS